MTPQTLARLHAACFTFPRPWSEAEFAALLGDPTVRLVAAGGGFLLGRVVAGEAEILTLAVLPAMRRRGIGRDLLARFLDAAAAEGAERAVLEVAETNAAARALYRGAGFVEAGRRRGYFARPDGAREDALALSRRLGGQP
ncbi:MAG: GNAT family N-acetyltransferase [Rhodobacteraceae bacterium]|nr:GNAT family N-acetyltransferase [Paracoccaceae bacterium]